MKEFVIVTDSCSDLDTAMRKKLNVEYIKMTIVSNNEEQLVDLDWRNFSPKEFYDSMRKGAQYKTTQVAVSAYEEHFEKYIKAGKDILSLTCSSGLSGSINSSLLAKKNILEKYPDAKIFCVDTLRGSLGEGLIVYYAAKMRDEGKTIEEIASWIEENRLNIHQVGTVEDLTYLKRAGRVTGAAAIICKILNIKPIIIADASGMNKSVAKVRGRAVSIREIINHTKKHIINPENQTIFVVHADCEDKALQVKEAMLTEIKCKDVYINYVGPVIGATVGPGMIGIYYYGDKITE